MAEPKLIQPTLLYDFPTDISPLSKCRTDDPSLVERFEVYVAGMELGNAFSELNDAEEQERRFREQVAQGGEEVPREVDLDYVRALAHGHAAHGGHGHRHRPAHHAAAPIRIPFAKSFCFRCCVRNGGDSRCPRARRRLWREANEIRLAGGAAVPAVAEQAGGAAAGDAAGRGRRGGGRGHAGDRAGDEQPVSAARCRIVCWASPRTSISRDPAPKGLSDYSALAERLGHTPGVRAVAPAIYLTVLLSSGNHARGVVVKGIDPALEAKRNEALQRIVSGAADFTPDRDGFDAVVVGKILADELELRVGDYVTLTSPSGRLTPFGMVPRSRRFRIAGIFDSGFYDYDANWGFVTLAAAQNLAGVGDVVSVLEFRIADVDRAEEMATRLGARGRGPGFMATTWMDENRALFRALRLEKLVTALFIGLITFVAGLNILVVLAMTVSDRAHDIAVLMAMGARREQIRSIFVLLGLAVGGVGNRRGACRGLLDRVGRGHLPTDSARPAGLLGSVCAVSSECQRRVVDCGSGAG